MAMIKQAKVALHHVVAIPYPAQGHVSPLLQLCQQLVPRGFTFTFINTHHIHHRIMRAAAAGASLSCADETNQEYYHNGCSSIRMIPVVGGSPPELHARSAGGVEAYRAALDMQGPVEHVLSTLLEGEQGAIDFILSDVYMGWSHATACKFGLRRVAFWPAAAATFSAFLFCADLALEGKSLWDVESNGFIHGIPGLPPTHVNDIQRVWDAAGYFTEFIRNFLLHFRNCPQASYVVFNTFSELEGPVLGALSHRIRILSIGPLLPSCKRQGQVTPQPRLSLFSEDETCLAWLDKQAPASVLFVSFGSISLRSDDQIRELAKGLEASQCPFLWVHRPNITYHMMNGANKNGADVGHGILEEFSEELGHRGLVVPWAPQLQVLVHPSVGGFITHCGWNSVMESVCMGVPMLCWADSGERMSNQRFVVEIWKCGMAMVSDSRRYRQNIEQAVLIKGEEVERAIRSLMLEEAGASCRTRVAQLKDAARLALQDSQARLDEFAGAMRQACHHTLA